MRPSRLVPFLLLAAVCTAAGAAGGRRTDRVVAIVGAIIIPMDSERLLQSYTVIVRGGVIAGMGPASAVDVPAGAERIDGTGLYLLPGLTDAHVHVRDAIELLSYLTHGVTTIVQLSGPAGNVPDVPELRRQVTRGDVPGPTIYTSGRMLGPPRAVGARACRALALSGVSGRTSTPGRSLHRHVRRSPAFERSRSAAAPICCCSRRTRW